MPPPGLRTGWSEHTFVPGSHALCSFTTIHSSGARQALSRLRFLAELSDSARSIPHGALTSLVSEAVDLVVFSHRGPDGPRVMEVVAVEDLAGAGDSTAFTTTEVFSRTTYDGDLTWTGNVPARAAAAFATAGIDMVDLLHGGHTAGGPLGTGRAR